MKNFKKYLFLICAILIVNANFAFAADFEETEQSNEIPIEVTNGTVGENISDSAADENTVATNGIVGENIADNAADENTVATNDTIGEKNEKASNHTANKTSSSHSNKQNHNKTSSKNKNKESLSDTEIIKGLLEEASSEKTSSTENEASLASGSNSPSSTENDSVSDSKSDLANEPKSDLANEPSEPVFKNLDIEFSETALNHALTQKFLTQYQAESSKKYLTAIMKNSYPYRAYVQKALKEADMPQCLQYLPVIESGYRTTALSKSGAHGIWQFMMNSISPYGMRVNMWMDERVDPWISTDAALKKLKENYDILGSWEMALAAYNSGLGAMRKAVKNGGTNDYWELCDKGFVRPETKNYVPKFIAVSTVLSNKEIYGLEFDEPDSENDKSVHFETISVNRNIDLKVLAEKSDIPLEDLRYYNPCLIYGITPPSISYALRVPEGTKAQVEDLMKNSIPLVKYHIYTVKSGDSIYALARHYGVPESEIQRVNKLNGSTIKIGQRLMIPAVKDVSEFSRPQSNEKIDFSGTHIVTDSDTLWSLALKYNVPLEVLASENNMEITDILRIGSTIKVPIIKQ